MYILSLVCVPARLSIIAFVAESEKAQFISLSTRLAAWSLCLYPERSLSKLVADNRAGRIQGEDYYQIVSLPNLVQLDPSVPMLELLLL